MDHQSPGKNGYSALDALFWRDEVLQVMFWMRGEGLGDSCTPEALASFLATDAGSLAETLDRMVVEEYLRIDDRAYSLTDRGRQEGARLFAEEFGGLTQQAHGECNNPSCACQTQGPEACESRTSQAKR